MPIEFLAVSCRVPARTPVLIGKGWVCFLVFIAILLWESP